MVLSTLEAFSFRWVSGLPEWGIPIAWGLVFSLPMVGLLVRIAFSHGLVADLFLCLTLLVGGCGGVVLAGDQLRSRRTRHNEEAAGRRSRFRAMLMSELRNRPAAQIDFPALVTDGDLPRSEADRVADEMFRRMADRFVEDGVITQIEQTKLDRLAKVLEIDSDRAASLLEESKSARYRSAVTDALADGLVTEEEARMLNELRDGLGVRAPTWTGSQTPS